MALESSAIPGGAHKSAFAAGSRDPVVAAHQWHTPLGCSADFLRVMEIRADRGSAVSTATPFGGEHEACVRLSFPLQVDQVDAPPNRNSEWRVHAIKLQMSFRRSFDQQRLYLFRGGVLHMRQNMRINVECERHAGMSQLFTDDLWGDPGDQ